MNKVEHTKNELIRLYRRIDAIKPEKIAPVDVDEILLGIAEEMNDLINYLEE